MNLVPYSLGHFPRALLVKFAALSVPGVGPSLTTLHNLDKCPGVRDALFSVIYANIENMPSAGASL